MTTGCGKRARERPVCCTSEQKKGQSRKVEGRKGNKYGTRKSNGKSCEEKKPKNLKSSTNIS